MCGLAGVIDLEGRREPDRARAPHGGCPGSSRPGRFRLSVRPGIGLAHRLSIVGPEWPATDLQRGSHRGRRSATASCSIIPSAGRAAGRGHGFRTHSDPSSSPICGRSTTRTWFRCSRAVRLRPLGSQRTVLLARDRFGICPLFGASRRLALFRLGDQGTARVRHGTGTADPRGLDHVFSFFALGTRRTCSRGSSPSARAIT